MTWLLKRWPSKNKGRCIPLLPGAMNKVGRADVDTVCVQRLITLDILVIRRPPSISDSEAQSYRRFYSYEAISSSEEVCGASTVIRSSWPSPKAMPLTQWHSKGAVAEDLTIPHSLNSYSAPCSWSCKSNSSWFSGWRVMWLWKLKPH